MFRFLVLKKLPPVLTELGTTFHQAGHEVYLVGGAVRNKLMGLPMNDFDLATSAFPGEVQKMFRRVIPTGIKHGTVTVLYKGHSFEITTFRVEGDYANKRHPDSVTFTRSIEEDLKRRDFTINAIALNLFDSTLVDPHEGRRDIRDGIIRAIGSPEERFGEDGLRLLRAVRFSAQLKFVLEPATLAALKTCHGNLAHVSAERIRDELSKILGADQPSAAFLLMEQAELLPLFLPELTRCRGIAQKGFHEYDVFDHSLLACDGAPADSLVLRLAALLHDIGKADTVSADELGIPTFHGHEQASESSARTILRRLKYPRAVEDEVCHLIRHHMFHYQEEWTDGAVRRFLSRVRPEHVPALFRLRRADQFGMSGSRTQGSNLEDFEARIDKVVREAHALTVRDLDVDGHVLHARGGIPKGPLMGVVLDFLLESVLEDPSLNEQDRLLELGRNFYETRLKTGK